jgi:hypothetical protein
LTTVIAAEQLSALSSQAPLVEPAVRPAPGPALRPVPAGPLTRLANPARDRSPSAALDDNPTVSQLALARTTARRGLPAPALVMRSVAMALLEIEAGCRSAEQLERRCQPALWDRVNQRLRRSGGAFVTGRSLVRVLCQEHSPGLADGVAVVRRDQRVSAVAMRLDAMSGRWVVTDLDF